MATFYPTEEYIWSVEESVTFFRDRGMLRLHKGDLRGADLDYLHVGRLLKHLYQCKKTRKVFEANWARQTEKRRKKREE